MGPHCGLSLRGCFVQPCPFVIPDTYDCSCINRYRQIIKNMLKVSCWTAEVLTRQQALSGTITATINHRCTQVTRQTEIPSHNDSRSELSIIRPSLRHIKPIAMVLSIGLAASNVSGLIEMWWIPNPHPNPTESSTFSEIQRILQIRSQRIRNC